MQLRDALKASRHSETGETDVLYWLSRAAMEFVGRGAMGHTFNTITQQGVAAPHPLVESLKAYLYGRGACLHLMK